MHHKMTKFDLQYNLKDALERTQITEADLEALRHPSIAGAPDTITDKQLVLFLNACGSVEATRKCIKCYYELKAGAPELFNNRNPISKEIAQCMEAQEYFCLPPTPKGYSVMFHRLHAPEPTAYNFENAIKTFVMTTDTYMNENGPTRGIIFLFDMKSVSLGHLRRVNIRSIRNFFKYLQEALPAKLKEIHVFNVVSFIDKVLFLIKPFIKKDVFKMLHFHTCDFDMEEFYKNTVPKTGLPSDLGGDLGTTRELHAEYCERIRSMADYFRGEEEQRKSNLQIKLDTSFDKLEID